MATPKKSTDTNADHDNGGGAKTSKNTDAKAGMRSGIGSRPEPDGTGDRTTRPSKEGDKVYTSDSKDRWGGDQPSLADQLEAAEKSKKKTKKSD